MVTHLPQVAAFADTHLVVEKAGDGSVTRSGVTRLDDAGRVTELSRMLAGLEDSEYGRAHAGELLTAAAAERATAAENRAERAERRLLSWLAGWAEAERKLSVLRGPSNLGRSLIRLVASSGRAVWQDGLR